MPENSVSVVLKINSEKVRKEISDVIISVQGAVVQSSADPAGCDVMVLELGENYKRDCESVHAVLAAGSAKEVFLILPRTDPELLLQAMRSGAREFITLPVNKEEVVQAMRKFKERHKSAVLAEKSRKRGKIINVVGSKGGIGTTTVAVNLAISLLELQGSRKSVALIDMNLLFGDIPIFLDIESAFNWGEVAKHSSRLDTTYLMSILSKHSSGLYFLPSPTQLDGLNQATPEIIERLLKLMQQEFDFIVIDSGQSFDEISLKVLELTDEMLVNATLSLPCLINVKRLLDTFKRFGYPEEDCVRVIVNRYDNNSVLSLKEAEKGIDKRIFWQIPNDYQTTISAINQGKTLADIAAKAEITQNIRELASKFIRQVEVPKVKKGFFSLQFLETKS